MNGILLAFLITLIGSINLNFYQLRTKPREYLIGTVQRLKFGIIVSFVLAYFYMPALVFPDYLVPLGIMLTINCAYTIATYRNVINTNNKKIISRYFSIPTNLLLIIIVIFAISPIIPLTQTQELRDIPRARISTEQLSSIDENQIRQVPYEFANWVSDKAIGDLGFKYNVGELHIQIIEDRLFWIAPLEFGNFFKWLQYRTSDGYILVDAEDPSGVGKRIDNLMMRYMESSYFQDNLHRHIYQKYPNYRFSEFTFELDDNDKPYWVVSATRPTVWNRGEKVFGVIIVDPVTGDIDFYERSKVPEWVDIVVPEVVAEDYNYWYGAYVHGFWNTKFAQKDMHLPTTKFGEVDVFAVRTDDGLVWFTGHTSPSNRDQSLTGYSTINTRTGEMIYYSNVSGYYNEEAAISAANSKVSNFAGYRGAQPVFYNLFGELTWVVPILSSNNKLQRISLVHAESGNVVVEENLELALRSYKEWLRDRGNTIVEVKDSSNLDFAEGVVDRIRGDHIVIKKGASIVPNIFRISGDESLITYEGDRVLVRFVKSNSTVIDVLEFDNLEYDFE